MSHDTQHTQYIHTHAQKMPYTCILTSQTLKNRSYTQLLAWLVPKDDDVEDDAFVDDDWELVSQVRSLRMCVYVHVMSHTLSPLLNSQVRTVEPVSEFAAGWRNAMLYRSRAEPKRACLYFGDDEYEGLVCRCCALYPH